MWLYRAMRQRRDRCPPVRGASPYRVVGRAVLRGAGRGWHDLRAGDLYRRGKEFELMSRAMGFAALALLTVIPLSIVVVAVSPAPAPRPGRVGGRRDGPDRLLGRRGDTDLFRSSPPGPQRPSACTTAR